MAIYDRLLTRTKHVHRSHSIILSATLSLTAAFAGPALAEGFKLGEDPVSVIMKWRPTTPDPQQQEFVKASRPDESALTYQRLRDPKVDRLKLKSKAEVKDMVGGLDAKASALRARGSATAGAGNATARQLQAAGAESRRRAAEDFAGVGASR